MLRPYQQEAHDKIISWISATTEPCLIEAATGAGKSHIIAAIADTVHQRSGKHVLCLAPSKELVEQNHSKYPGKASFFSASVGIKSLDHPVVFGTPLTVKNSIEKFGNEIAMIVLDECHGITPTIKGIVSAIKGQNPNVRVVGMSATPYRMHTGHIYRENADGSLARNALEPYFRRCVYKITAPSLIAQGYLTPPEIGAIGSDGYATKGMVLNRMGQFDAADVDRAYHGQGRKTAAIIFDVVQKAQGRHGVLIFAATVRHAQECLQSLPVGISAIVTGDTPKRDREDILRRFKAREIKYIVNVSVLTTGFDAEHVDVISMLRATESVGLMQQIIGRGLRLSPGKTECVVLDYAENIERHCPDGDIFRPNVEIRKPSEPVKIECECPLCKTLNTFNARPNPDGYQINENGYFCDLDGMPIEGEFGPIPAHYGRRCPTTLLIEKEFRQCSYRWTGKECKECHAHNDIAARYCTECQCELVDPNEKLRIEFMERKKDPTLVQTDKVLGWKKTPSLSRSGNPTYMIKVVTEYRSITYWVQVKPKHPNALASLFMLMALGDGRPSTITYRKGPSGFYDVLAYNRTPDEAPE